MSRSLDRLFRPRSIAVVGGGAWCEQVITQSQRMGFPGTIHPVHPKASTLGGLPAVPRLEDLPTAPDAVFLGINRDAAITAMSTLSAMGAGGAVCFASGFAEAAAEDATGQSLQARLVAAAGPMPFLGPNCYGFINALDGALLWPDQHGCQRQESGVAILTQSSNIAINLTMQRRALPLAYVVTCGNMAQTGQAEIATALLDDPRVTAIGLHIEGFSDLRAWEGLAAKAWAKGVPLVALKVGRSAQAQSATISHTASLAGGDAGASALLSRLGIPRVTSLPELLESLKLMHFGGPLKGGRLASISCSGGEASLAADTAHGRALTFPPLNPRQLTDLRAALGPKVALANPLDYHTYIWRDTPAMTRAFSAMTDPQIDLTLLVVDYPHTDPSDWTCATDAAIGTAKNTGTRVAVVATLPELMPEETAQHLASHGVIPMHGLAETIAAAEAAAQSHAPDTQPLLLPGQSPATRKTDMLSEAEAKSRLAQHGLAIPAGQRATRSELAQAAARLTAPLVLKGEGAAHKSEAGLVRLGLAPQDVAATAATMPADCFLLEEMVPGAVAELLVGVTRDPAHGFCLTLGAGGTMTELWSDSQTLLIPATADTIQAALHRLRIWPLLAGFRGKPGANMPALLAAIAAIQSYVIENAACVEEVEVNPLLCTPTAAIAADALIREARP